MIYVYDIITKEHLGWTNDASRLGVDATAVVPPTPTDTAAGFWNGTSWDVRIRSSASTSYANAVEALFQKTANSWGYDSLEKAATYADEPAVPQFQNEGQALRAWRSLSWAKCYQILSDVSQGLRPVPTIDQLTSELPPIVRP
jgi:hypothetical protein